MARPTKYSKALAERICAELMQGKSVREICVSKAFPAQSTIYKWLSEKPAFSEQYARAREVQAHIKFDEILEIADETSEDFKIKEDKDGNPIGFIFDKDHVQRAKLRIGVRQWQMAKLAPKKYGDKVELDAGGPLQVIIQK